MNILLSRQIEDLTQQISDMKLEIQQQFSELASSKRVDCKPLLVIEYYDINST